MGFNNVRDLSKIIENELNQDISLDEVLFAIDEIEKILLIEKEMEERTTNELFKSKNSCIRMVTLGEYLDEIKNNINKLNFFLEILNSKKRVLEYKTRRIISEN